MKLRTIALATLLSITVIACSTPAAQRYKEAYARAMADGVITKEERAELVGLAGDIADTDYVALVITGGISAGLAVLYRTLNLPGSRRIGSGPH